MNGKSKESFPAPLSQFRGLNLDIAACNPQILTQIPPLRGLNISRPSGKAVCQIIDGAASVRPHRASATKRQIRNFGSSLQEQGS